MKTTLKLALLAFLAVAATLASAQQPPPAGSLAQTQKTVEDFLRYFYALGADIKITVGAPKPIGSSGLSELPIVVKSPEGSDNVVMYLTSDGRYLLRGEISDLTKDPLAENIAKMQTAGAPVYGDPKAPITIVEYSDFQCPVCRNLHDAIRGILPNYPQVKIIFKDFPLDNIHPWARTAALGGRCAYQQDPKAFWKLYDLIYDNQDLISASNAYEKMIDYAGKIGLLNTDTFKSCLSGPQAAAEVDASTANARLLDVRSTPTLFINGRRLVGADPHALQQYIDYEVAHLKSPKK
ncbi:MAG: thioredoxin domain-containing protein [Candidatus Acidiferrum sp.]